EDRKDSLSYYNSAIQQYLEIIDCKYSRYHNQQTDILVNLGIAKSYIGIGGITGEFKKIQSGIDIIQSIIDKIDPHLDKPLFRESLSLLSDAIKEKYDLTTRVSDLEDAIRVYDEYIFVNDSMREFDPVMPRVKVSQLLIQLGEQGRGTKKKKKANDYLKYALDYI
ncbi:MAG: hypothetical protein N0C86_05735, partial [Candidatus Thiodiazotropha taylori]|nr:hypothetical protein [Candidatus Thiodiazotropha taylori]MCW4325482.1 hypothetical protein [Candidatus Thiodiazotropha taylori]